MATNFEHLLDGYVTDVLTDSERRELMDGALADQDVFDRLVEEETWRHLFADTHLRRDLLAAVREDRPSWFASAFGRLRTVFSPQGTVAPTLRWATAGLAAAALAAVVVLPRLGPEGPVEPDLVSKNLSTETARSATRSLTAPVDAPVLDQLRFSWVLELEDESGVRPAGEDYEFQPGDRFRLRLETDFDAWLYLMNRASGEDAWTVVYPQTTPEHQAMKGELVLPPGTDEWFEMDDTPADERLVLRVSRTSWPAFSSTRSAVPDGELTTELERVEKQLDGLGWRQSLVDGRGVVEIAAPPADLTYVVRLLER